MKKIDWRAIYLDWKRGWSPKRLSQKYGVPEWRIGITCERIYLAR